MTNQKYKIGSANIIPSDYPDPDVIRVDDTYYMVSTTMHFMPGCVILRSYNLLDWEFCSYVYEDLDRTPQQQLLNNKGVYGKGMWAASLRYHKGLFYVSFVANDTGKSYLFTSADIKGPWKKSEIAGFYHDMSILFDDDENDGRVFIVHGNTQIHLTEMKSDLSGPKEGGINKIIIEDNREKVNLGYEGSHFYKIKNKYYIFLIHMPKDKMRTEACFVADKIDGPYKGCDVLHSDLGNWKSGLAQGGIVQANDGKWYGILFQDHGALGRIPILVPVTFKNDFPVFGETDSIGQQIAPQTVKVLDNNPDYKYAPLYTSDFTDKKGKLHPLWQWNHTHNPELAKIENNTLEIKTDKIVKNPVQAANTLTQRTFSEQCLGSVTLDASKINEGDYAGLCALEGEYAFIALTKKDGKFFLVTADHTNKYSPWTMNVYDDDFPAFHEEIPLEKLGLDLTASDNNKAIITLQLKFSLHYKDEKVQLMYLNPKTGNFEQVGKASPLRYTLDQFVGVRFAMFMYSTKTPGGIAKFSDFKYDFW